MKSENEILAEIHRHREEHAKECGYDVGVMFARMRENQKRSEAAGWRVVTLLPRRRSIADSEAVCILREEPPK